MKPYHIKELLNTSEEFQIYIITKDISINIFLYIIQIKKYEMFINCLFLFKKMQI